jgi:hypothetical protein
LPTGELTDHHAAELAQMLRAFLGLTAAGVLSLLPL